jgi:pimeloyl-ACP methyl ester carboxylesterase
MKLSNMMRAAIGANLGPFLAVAFCMQAAAQNTLASGVKNVVLVHGAWADGSSWSKVIPLLEAKGLHVTAVQLPLTSLADDVATTERAIALESGPVILVGHSYGGAVITEAGNDPKVAGLVFVAAFAPDDGESALSLANANPSPVGNELRPDPNGFLKLAPEGITQDFAQDLPEEQRKILIATQGPTAGAAFGAPITSPAWKTKPVWFIIAANDRIVSPDLERKEATRMNATSITLSTGHLAMLADPGNVAAFIESAAARAGAK